MSSLQYTKQVVVVTGAGNGLGREYAKFFASRGAQVVVNDLGGSFNGEGNNSKVADQVVQEITDAGGIAVPNYDPVENGERIIETAIKAFGRVDVLVNNAGILRDVTLRNMTNEDWDLIMAVHLTGPFRTTRAAWPYFRKQRYGKVINTTSSSGLFGNFGQANYAAAKMALVGFTETLAKEGAKYNIRVNVIAPGAGSRLTQTVWPPEMMEAMRPDFVVPLVGTLVHSSCQETGSIFEAAAGHFSKIRWERSQGLLLKPDDGLTADALLRDWGRVVDFSNAEHPTRVADSMALLEKASQMPNNQPGDPLTFQGRVALITGGGDGLGRAYSLHFARLGAKVAVNDLRNAERVVEEITKLGGEAVAVPLSVEDGQATVQKVIDTFGRIDVVVNNAGILRDKAFQNMTEELWNPVLNVHLRGTYRITKAAWPYMIKQKYGRIVNITSTSGIYGNFGQANYAAAKCGIVGFSKTTAREGAKHNIVVNAVAPSAGTNMTRTVRSEEEILSMKPEFVAPLVSALSSEIPPCTGSLFEAGCGWYAATRWQRTRGVDFPHEEGVPSVEAVAEAFSEICNFDNGQADNPESPADGSRYTVGNIQKNPKMHNLSQEDRANRQYHSKIQNAIQTKGQFSEYSYTDRDVILYNLGIGAKRADMSLVYEGSPEFQALPTFGVIPTYFSKAPVAWKDILPNYDPRMLLHGEQYLELKQFPIPTSGTLRTETHVIEVIDKGNAALVRRGSNTIDASGKPVFYSESLAFVRGSGGFGGPRTPSNRGAVTSANVPPPRVADKVVEEKTTDEQAALYRLMGDRNPLHIDPIFSSAGGFNVPILHGLASFGISGKHIYQTYGPFKNIKVRFAGTVLPGETLMTEMWREGQKVIYRVKVKESGKVCINNAAVELISSRSLL